VITINTFSTSITLELYHYPHTVHSLLVKNSEGCYCHGHCQVIRIVHKFELGKSIVSQTKLPFSVEPFRLQAMTSTWVFIQTGCVTTVKSQQQWSISSTFVPNILRSDGVCSTHAMKSALILTRRNYFEAQLLQSMWKRCPCVRQTYLTSYHPALPPQDLVIRK